MFINFVNISSSVKKTVAKKSVDMRQFLVERDKYQKLNKRNKIVKEMANSLSACNNIAAVHKNSYESEVSFII